MPRKRNFSPQEIIVIAGFLNISKEHHIFSEFKHGFCDKMKKKNGMRKRVVREAHFPKMAIAHQQAWAPHFFSHWHLVTMLRNLAQILIKDSA